MRILVVALADSIHVARWIRQMSNQGWDIHLFPSIDTGTVHPDLEDVTVYHSVYHLYPASPQAAGVRRHGFRIPAPERIPIADLFGVGARKLLGKRNPAYRVDQLVKVIRKLQPDIIHSMELQAAGYLTLQARQQFPDNFPPWIISNYGSDIYLFGRLQAHQERLRALLASCDYYLCECERDVSLAQEMGLRGEVLDVIPVGGGFNVAHNLKFRQPGLVSQRRTILIKGYQGWSGRALVALYALEQCADVLQGYRIVIHLGGNEDVAIQAELTSREIGIPIEVVPAVPHETMLRLHGESRVHVGLGISDGISTSVLEAMTMGDFPIQSYTACADEWFDDGVGGLLVPPENPDAVAQALRRALTDDALVDHAAEINLKVITERLDEPQIRKRIVALYERVYQAKR